MGRQTKKRPLRFLEDLFLFVYPKDIADKQYIYFVVSHQGKNEWQNRVKIGRSATPQKRLAELQIGNPNELRMWHCFPVPKDKAHSLENQLHRIFRWSKHRGEWFKIHPAVRDFILAHKKALVQLEERRRPKSKMRKGVSVEQLKQIKTRKE